MNRKQKGVICILIGCILMSFGIVLRSFSAITAVSMEEKADTQIPMNSVSQAEENEAHLLASIIEAEAHDESYAAKVAIGAVILNRVNHPSFPNSLGGVIYQPDVFKISFDNTVLLPQSYQAAHDALNGWDPTGGAIYYYKNTKPANQWLAARPVLTRISNYTFLK